MLSHEQLQQLRSEPVIGRNRLARAMELAGVTQLEVEAGTGIRQPWVSAIKRGQYKSLPLDTCQALARFFGCLVDDLFPAREIETQAVNS